MLCSLCAELTCFGKTVETAPAALPERRQEMATAVNNVIGSREERIYQSYRIAPGKEGC